MLELLQRVAALLGALVDREDTAPDIREVAEKLEPDIVEAIQQQNDESK